MSSASLEREQLVFASVRMDVTSPAAPAAAPIARTHGPESTKLEIGQPVLRPVAFFVDMLLVAPARARDVCIPVAKRRPKDFRFRRMREGRKPLSIGQGKLRGKERRDLAVMDYQAPILGIRPHKPLTVLQCQPGPCSRVGCEKNLYLDVDPDTGCIKLNFPDLQVDELIETCADRVAQKYEQLQRQPLTEMVAKLLNLTAERLRQIEKGAIAKLGPAVEALRPV